MAEPRKEMEEKNKTKQKERIPCKLWGKETRQYF